MQSNLYHLHALSALHCGTGQAVGVVDLPIARARATNLPIVPGTSVRGVLRDEFAGKPLEHALFGPRGINGNDEAHAGAMAVGDAHLLLLPVRALAGIVAYATCPFILKRYAMDCGATTQVPQPRPDEAIHADGNCNIVDRLVVLEDLDLRAQHDAAATAWAERIAAVIFSEDKKAQDDLKQRFLILPDEVFAFLAETATEIRTRIAIDRKTGVVAKGALWSEENLPAESILWGLYAMSDSRAPGNNTKADALLSELPGPCLLQLGGKAGVGRGLTRLFFTRGA